MHDFRADPILSSLILLASHCSPAKNPEDACLASSGVVPQVVDAPRKVPDQAEQHVHRRRLHVPTRLPTGDRVRAESEQARKVRLRKAEPFADRADLVGRKKPALLTADRDRILVESFRLQGPQHDLAAFRALEMGRRRHNDLFAVDRQTQPTPPFPHHRAAGRARVVGKKTAANPGVLSSATGLLHSQPAMLVCDHSLTNYAYS